MPSRRRAAIALLATWSVATLAAAAPHGSVTVRVEGSLVGGAGRFEGSLAVTGFEAKEGEIIARGTLDGTFEPAGARATVLPAHAVTLALQKGSLEASCDAATFSLPIGEMEGAGRRARLEPVRIEITATNAPGQQLHERLCALGKLVASGAPPDATAQQLDRVLDALR